MIVYLITNLKNNKKYVGITSYPTPKKRFDYHSRAKSILGTAIRKYGLKNFSCEIICKCSSLEELLIEEVRQIKKYKSYGSGYNLTPGGEMAGVIFDQSEIDMSDVRNAISKKFKDRWDKLSKTERKNRTRGFTAWNKLRWQNKSSEERFEEIKHLFTKQVYDKKAKTLKKYWANNDERKRLSSKQQSDLWRKFSKDEYENRCDHNRVNGLKGAKSMSVGVRVTRISDGYSDTFESISEAARFFNVPNGTIAHASTRKKKLFSVTRLK